MIYGAKIHKFRKTAKYFPNFVYKCVQFLTFTYLFTDLFSCFFV